MTTHVPLYPHVMIARRLQQQQLIHHPELQQHHLPPARIPLTKLRKNGRHSLNNRPNNVWLNVLQPLELRLLPNLLKLLSREWSARKRSEKLGLDKQKRRMQEESKSDCVGLLTNKECRLHLQV